MLLHPLPNQIKAEPKPKTATAPWSGEVRRHPALGLWPKADQRSHEKKPCKTPERSGTVTEMIINTNPLSLNKNQSNIRKNIKKARKISQISEKRWKHQQ